jgi:hypothetical protein
VATVPKSSRSFHMETRSAPLSHRCSFQDTCGSNIFELAAQGMDLAHEAEKHKIVAVQLLWHAPGRHFIGITVPEPPPPDNLIDCSDSADADLSSPLGRARLSLQSSDRPCSSIIKWYSRKCCPEMCQWKFFVFRYSVKTSASSVVRAPPISPAALGPIPTKS